MSYFMSLDEYDEKILRMELARREKARANGLCDYCGRSPSTPPCRFPKRHQPEAPDAR